MRNFLDSKILSIFTEFDQNVAGQRFCKLKTLRFDWGNVPDYNELSIQQLYLLRYLAGYTVEYKLMYEYILAQNFLDIPIEILSFGAGCGIDLYGAFFAVKERGIDPVQNLRYTGLDKVDWSHYQDDLGLANVDFLTCDIAASSSFPADNYNVLMFPKSISEFNDQVFIHLKWIFQQTNFSRNKICLISSLRESSITRDSTRVKELALILVDRGFACLDNVDVYLKLTDPRSLRHYMGGYFRYPDIVLGPLASLNEHCSEYQAKGQNCYEDCKDLARWPMLKTELTRFKCLRFERSQ